MNHRLALVAGIGSLLLTACGGASGGGSASRMFVSESSNGFGTLLPHRVFEADSNGMPTDKIVEIRSQADLENVSFTNPIFAPVEWPTTAILPNGDAGNHFLYTKFTRPISLDSVFDPSAGAASVGNLKGTITVLAVDPDTGTTTPVIGRAFIGGRTYGKPDPGNPALLQLERWIGLADGKPVALSVDGAFPGLGFPGTQSATAFAGAADLASPKTFVFVPDADGDLTTLETFPSGVQIRMRMTNGVSTSGGGELEAEALASSTVGPDTIPVEVAISAGSPLIIPGNGDIDVDPETAVTVEFTEPVQLLSLGNLDDGKPPTSSSAVQLQFGPPTARADVPFHVRPFSVFDMTRFELMPAYNFPGSDPDGVSDDPFSQVDVIVNAPQIADLAGNVNTQAASTFFVTAEGPGLVNVPVLPDVVYALRGGAKPGISVVDLNGFGQGTGDPTYDPAQPIKEGNTNFPNNPNVNLQGSIILPPLAPGTSTIDGGSPGVFSLAKDSSLNDIVAGKPILDSVTDVMVGHSLDLTFNNGLPFGCQSGGGNICTSTGLKVVQVAQGGGNSLQPSTISTVPLKTEFGAENLVSWAPHPNPPPLIFPPLCISPAIGAKEPTSVITILPPPPLDIGLGLSNLLGPSALPQGDPSTNTPPQGLLALAQNGFFVGPQLPQVDITLCRSFGVRQQIGQFLYVADRAANQIVVFNSNRMTVIDRVFVPDPTDLAMSPNIDFLAVTSQGADTVTFIDIDPSSSSFHEIVDVVRVGSSPIGVAWDPDNEDILVANNGSNSVSIISAFNFQVRKTLIGVTRPVDVLPTPRQLVYAFNRGVYYAYILTEEGKVLLYESGPGGFNGWGFDDLVGEMPFTFTNATSMKFDMIQAGRMGMWITHERALDSEGNIIGPVGTGALTNIAVSSATTGVIPVTGGAFVNPHLRDIQFEVVASIGEAELTGVPVQVAFDNQINVTALTNFATQFSAGDPISINGKCVIRTGGTAAQAPQFIFAAVPNSDEGPGVIDVLELTSTVRRTDTNVFEPGIQSIPCSGVIGLAEYFDM